MSADREMWLWIAMVGWAVGFLSGYRWHEWHAEPTPEPAPSQPTGEPSDGSM